MQVVNILIWFALLQKGLAIDLDVNDKDSIRNAANIATYGMMTYYSGNETGGNPGAFPDKWWEGSALMLGLLNYWHFTGDDYYNDELSEGLVHQGGEDENYLPSNYSHFLGNDDQMFWGLSAMTAAEWKLPDRKPYSWLGLGQGTYNTQRDAWDASTCGGGLHWQLWSFENGYELKNAVSNGGFFQLAARLYRYTNNTDYLDWARKSWEWSCTVPLVNNKTWIISDSTSTTDDCATGDTASQWSYNYGIYMGGCAYLYSMTLDDYWLQCTKGLMGTLFDKFFTKKNNYIMSDYYCESQENCNNNEVLFKGLVHSWLANTALLIPSLFDEILAKLQSSAIGASKSCTGMDNNTCGVRWALEKWDNQVGMEKEISASNAFSVLMLKWMNGTNSSSPVTSTTGGNSTSNVNASVGEDGGDGIDYKPITTADKVGAGILTALFVGGTVGAAVWMCMSE